MSNNQDQSHASAAGAYGQNAQSHTPDQRELEARVLLKSANRMQVLRDNWDKKMTPEELDEVLRYNRQLWLMFVDTAIEDEDPERGQDLRNNIANLGIFIFNHTVNTLAQPEKNKLDILIEINKEIAAGLMQKNPDEASKTNHETGKNEADNSPAKAPA